MRSFRAPLTADGERIAALAARMEEASFAVGRAVRTAQPALAGEVSISAPPLLASTVIAPRLAELRRMHPGLHVRLIGEKRSASLSRREADLAVRLSRPTENRLVVRKIGTLIALPSKRLPDAFAREGEAFLQTILDVTPPDGSMSEQFSKENGSPVSANQGPERELCVRAHCCCVAGSEFAGHAMKTHSMRPAGLYGPACSTPLPECAAQAQWLDT